tara:strand:+ start:698 stop:2113 length:1416 start_codon:yes stop_codon:yes gene_type:complete
MNNISNNFNPPKEDLDALIYLYKNGRLKDVLDKSEQMVLKHSNSIFLYNLRGSAYALLKKFDAALECYKNALKVNPNYAAIYNNLGNVFKEIGEIELAKNNYEQAINIKPNYAEAYYGLGLTLEKKGEFLSAIRNYENALINKPNYPEVFFNLGNVYRKSGDYELAIKNYKNAIKLKKNYYEAYCNLGNSKKDLGDIKAAKFYYKKALKINPKDFETMWNMHGVSFSIDEAIKWLDKCLKAEDSCLKAKLMLSALKYLKNDKFDYNQFSKTNLKRHPFMRSFNWLFQLKNTPKLFFNKFSLFDYVIKNSIKSRPFYEFGVWKGVSFEYIIRSIKKGFGFDTFTGLPENWYDEKVGTYSSDGVIPKINGGKFITGSFKERLPKFFLKKRPLASIINFDADLYSSTLCALENCKKIIDDSTILIFDEFLMSDKWEEDEFKALNEFCMNNNLSYEVIAVSLFSKQVAIKVKKHL